MCYLAPVSTRPPADPPAPTTPTVSVVIPNWNGAPHLPTCLASLRSQSLTPLETLLVDNGSTDGSRELVARDFPEITILPLPSNRGFAAAVNHGIRTARGTFVALLNNDTELDRDWLLALVSVLERHPGAASTASRMLRFDDRSTIDGAGDLLTRGGLPLTRGSGEPARGAYDREEEIFGACAGAALYRRRVLLEVGLFDEEYVSYYEDADLSLRLRLEGYTCIYTPAAVCYHKRGATASLLRNHYPIRMQERNLTLLHLKNLPWRFLLRNTPVILAARTRRLARAVRAGLARPAAEGLLEGILLIPSALAGRRTIRNPRPDLRLFGASPHPHRPDTP